jgi:hypothetical protein
MQPKILYILQAIALDNISYLEGTRDPDKKIILVLPVNKHFF